MKICHVGSFKIGTSNGSYNALWSLACAQVAQGDEVTIIRVGKMVADEQIKLAKLEGVNLIGFPAPRWRGFWKDKSGLFLEYLASIRPDIVHLQYVRIPKYIYISKLLKSIDMPYVISLHGGLNKVEMKRRKYRKLLYWQFIEKSVHQKSAGIHFVTNREMQDYKLLHSSYAGKKRVVYNAVETVNQPNKKDYSLQYPISFVYLGRYDIWHKGVDLLFEFLKELDGLGVKTELHLYGNSGEKYKKPFSDLCKAYESLKIIDHGFVDGHAKFLALSKNDFYIQFSRFELFGMSIVEALNCGVPTLLSENCDISDDLVDNKAAIRFGMDPQRAAVEFKSKLDAKMDFMQMGLKGKQWAANNCSPSNIVKKMDAFYNEVIDG